MDLVRTKRGIQFFAFDTHPPHYHWKRLELQQEEEQQLESLQKEDEKEEKVMTMVKKENDFNFRKRCHHRIAAELHDIHLCCHPRK